MKLKGTFETVDMGEEIIAVPVGPNANEIHGILKINKEAKEILDCLGRDTSESAIIDLLKAKYENSEESISSYVHSFLQSIRDAGLLEE